MIQLADLNNWTIGAVAPTNFHLKWYVGPPCCKVVVYKIAEGELTANDGVPQNSIKKIGDLNIVPPPSQRMKKEVLPAHHIGQLCTLLQAGHPSG
jgi:hypothetical protein